MRTTLVIVLAAVSLAACKRESSVRRDPLPPGEAAQILAERVWLDRAPRTERDRFFVAVFDPGGIAISQHRSIWKGDFELVRWKARGDKLEIVLPHSGKRVVTGFRVVPIKDRHADYKLSLDENPVGPREYIGFNPEGDGAVTVEVADAWLRALVD